MFSMRTKGFVRIQMGFICVQHVLYAYQNFVCVQSSLNLYKMFCTCIKGFVLVQKVICTRPDLGGRGGGLVSSILFHQYRIGNIGED